MKQPTMFTVYAKKGGVYKTSMVQNLTGVLSIKDSKKTLMIERDFQGHLGMAFGVNSDNVDYTFSDLFLGDSSLDKTIIKLEKNVDAILENDQAIFLEERAKKKDISIQDRYSKIIEEIKNLNKYDYIIFDLPARQDVFSALVFSTIDKVVIPFELAPYGVDGVVKVLRDLNNYKDKSLNPNLKIAGIVPVKGRRTRVNKSMIEQGRMIFPVIADKFKETPITNEVIMTSTKYDEAITDYSVPLTFVDLKEVPKKRDREQYEKQFKVYYNLSRELGLL